MQQDTDELFLVIEGEMDIEFEDHTVSLSTGEMCVVPKGLDISQRLRMNVKLC